MVAGRRMFASKQLRLRNAVCYAQRPSVGSQAAVNRTRDASATVVETVAALALRSQLRRGEHVAAEVYCTSFGLLAGRVEAAKVIGRKWESPLGLTAQQLEAEVGQVQLDYPAVLTRQRIVLRNVPTGTLRVVFSGMDFGNFLRHPLVVAVAQQAVAGQRFEFGRGPARVSPAGSEPLHPFGAVHFSGTWAGATPGKQYQLTMAPASANGNNGVIITAVLADGGVDESCATVADGLQRFFNTLFVDLQGAELRFARLQLAPATGVGSREWHLDLELSLRVREFPPLNVRF